MDELEEDNKALQATCSRHSADLKQHNEEEERCKKKISHLKKESEYMTDDYDKEQLYQKNEEIVRLTKEVLSLEERLNLSTEQKNSLEAKNEKGLRRVHALSDQLDFEQRYLSQSNKRLSVIEKQYASLNKELSMVLGGLPKTSELYTNLENRGILDNGLIKSIKNEKEVLEIENNNLNDQTRLLQEQWDGFKTDESTQHEPIRNEITSLQRQKGKLEQDNPELQKHLHSLENKISEQDRRYETVNEERSKQDNMVAQHLDENNGPKKKLKKAKAELHTAEKESATFSQNLQQELNCGKLELDRLKKEKTELITDFEHVEVQSKKNIDKINKLELENKTYHERYTTAITSRQITEKEVQKLTDHIQDEKNKRREIQEELEAMKKDMKDLEIKLRETMQRLERVSADLESRISSDENAMQCDKFEMIRLQLDYEASKLQIKNAEEKNDEIQRENYQLKKQIQVSNDEQYKSLTRYPQVRNESIKRAQVAVDYDDLVYDKSKHIGSQFLKMYQNQWKGAMVELGPTGDEKKNIAYLLHILERAYLFSANMAPRFADVFEQALFSVSINIQESNDIQFLVRQILDQLSDCMKQTFLQEQDLQHDAKINPAVGVFIGEAVALCWLMVIQSPRVYLSTTIPKKFDPELFEPYSHSGSEVDFVVWPVIKLSDNEGPVICRGKAVLKSLEA